MDITKQVHDYWNAGSCGTDRTEADKHSVQYFDEIAAFRYSHEPCIPAFARFNEWKGKDVLEVGVGAGTDHLSFARAGARMSGVDLTEEAVENTSKRLNLYGLESDLRVCNAEHLPFADGSFDLVYSWGVIHHANDTEQCLREIARVVKPGGTVKLMLYNRASIWATTVALMHGTLNRKKAMWNWQESVGTKAYTRAEAADLVARCGLTLRAIDFDNQLIRKGARFEHFRRWLDNVAPRRWRWYMMIEAVRP